MDYRIFNFIIATFFSRAGSLLLLYIFNYRVVENGHSASYLSTLTALMYLPNFVLSIISGKIADSKNNKHLLLLFDLCSIVLISVYLFIFFDKSNNYIVIALVIMILNSIAALYGPVSRTFTPKLIEKSFLYKYNTIYTLSSDIVKFIVPALMVFPFILGLSINQALIIDVISFVISFVFTLSIKYEEEIHNQDVIVEKYDINQIKGIINEILTLFITNICVAGFSIYLPFYAKLYYLESYPKFVSAQAVGAILLSVFLIFKKKDFGGRKKFTRAYIMFATLFLFFLIIDNLYMALVITGFIGAIISYIIINFYSIIQTEIGKKSMGKTFGFIGAITLIASPLGCWFFGYFIDLLGNRSLLVLSGLIYLHSVFIYLIRNGRRKKC